MFGIFRPLTPLLASLALIAPLRGQTTMTFREGVNGYAHAAALIRADNPSLNSGARDQLIVGKTSGAARAVFSFDVTAVPAGATVTAVSLDLWTDAQSSTAAGSVGQLELHRLVAAPAEGTGTGSGGTGAGTGATWISRDGLTGAGHAWTAAGGDLDSAILSSVPGFLSTTPDVQKTFATSPAFVAAAQTAVGLRQPLGLIVLSPTTEAGAGTVYTRLSSDDSATLAARPRLTLTYLVGGAVPPPVFYAVPVSWSRVALSWMDPSANETGFEIERRVGPDGVWSPAFAVGADVTRVEDASLDPATGYGYRIKAIYADGESAYIEAPPVSTPGATARSSIVVLPLGDSITQGTINGGYRAALHAALVAGGYSASFAGSQTNYPTAELTAAGNDHHEGHGGYTIRQIIANLDAGGHWLDGVAGTRGPVYPDLILLMIGTNDLGVNEREVAPTLADYDELLTKLAAMRPSAFIVAASLIPYTGTSYVNRERHQLEFNAALPALVAAHQAAGERVRFYDMRTRITAQHISTDFVHPTKPGYDAIGAAWFEAFQRLPLIENWRQANFGSAAASGQAQPLSDPDGDGAPNLAEYAFGTNPKTGGDGAAAIVPFVRSDSKGNRFAEFSIRRRRDADLRYQAQATDDLGAGNWTTSLTQIGAAAPIDDDFELVTYRDAAAPADWSHRFFRVRVTAP